MKGTIISKKGHSDEYSFTYDLNFKDGDEEKKSQAFEIASGKINSVMETVIGMGKNPALGEKYYKMFAQIKSTYFWINNKNERWQDIAKSIILPDDILNK